MVLMVYVMAQTGEGKSQEKRAAPATLKRANASQTALLLLSALWKMQLNCTLQHERGSVGNIISPFPAPLLRLHWAGLNQLGLSQAKQCYN